MDGSQLQHQLATISKTQCQQVDAATSELVPMATHIYTHAQLNTCALPDSRHCTAGKFPLQGSALNAYEETSRMNVRLAPPAKRARVQAAETTLSPAAAPFVPNTATAIGASDAPATPASKATAKPASNTKAGRGKKKAAEASTDVHADG